MAWEVVVGIILMVASAIIYFGLKMSKVVW